MAAFKFYERCLGGKIAMMMTQGESPLAEQASPELRDKIMHVRLEVAGDVLMGSDSPREFYQGNKDFPISLRAKSPTEAERAFQVAENGTVRMPMQQTFWAVRFGMLVDQFGISWMVNC
jgi:PhnB protein